MERELIGRGNEHFVYRSKVNPKVLLKKPNIITLLLSKFSGDKPSDLRRQLQETQTTLQSTMVRIPRTRLVTFGSGYIIDQDFIEEDHSISNIRSFLRDQNVPILVHLYDSNSNNFICNEGISIGLILFWALLPEF